VVEPELETTGGAEREAGAIRPDVAAALRRIRQIQDEQVVRLGRAGCYWALEILPFVAGDVLFCPRPLELPQSFEVR
jgi:hypothetical protein